MQQEIEAKFLHVDHNAIRAKLKAAGATCEVPMRLMRRKMFDYPDRRFQTNHQRLRIRDEGNGKAFINYKSSNDSNYVDEVEVLVSSLEDMATILKALGLINHSTQESKRETWHYKDVEVVLDEWPWVDTYIEIEGPTEAAIQKAAKELGFKWEEAEFGSVDDVYKAQFTKMTEADSIGEVADVSFGQDLPQYLLERK